MLQIKLGGMPRVNKNSKKESNNTVRRILAKSLHLFNQFGEPNVTTNMLAQQLEISPGNLYYHFRNKEDIVNSLFAEFEKDIAKILTVPDRRSANIEDAWLFLHLFFETIWRYRFFYRDLNDLLTRNRRLEISFQKILDAKITIAESLCQGLLAHGELSLADREIKALATNMMVLATYWLSYEHLRHARNFHQPKVIDAALARGVYQTLSVLAPALTGQSRILFDQLAHRYLGE
jgi:AcrR family transcriptional regulator